MSTPLENAKVPLTTAEIGVRYRARLKAKVYAAYGGRCACCGEAETSVLQLDHVRGGGNKHRLVVRAGPMLHKWLVDQGFPPDFQILCANCNQSKSLRGTCYHVG